MGSGNSLGPEAPAATLGDGARQKTTVVAEICFRKNRDKWLKLSFLFFFLRGGGGEGEHAVVFLGKPWKLMFETVRENLDQRNKSFVVLKFSQLIFWKTIVFHQPVQADLSFFLGSFEGSVALKRGAFMHKR